MSKAALAFLLLGICSLLAQPVQTLQTVQRTSQEMILDGLDKEQAWTEANPFDLVMYLPEHNQPPTEKTWVRLLHNDDFLFVFARLYDSEVSRIQVASLQRDYMQLRNDFFGVIIDSYNDKENALAFFTSPAGTRTDFVVFDDGNGDFPLNENWNSYWDVETRQDDSGWTVEMRIPLSSLRYQVVNGKVRMGLILWRWIARKAESSIYPAIPPKWGWWGQVKPSQSAPMVINGISTKKPLYVAPYVLGGLSRDNELNDPETEYDKKQTRKSDIGLDVKYGVTSNMIMDLTVNTDFAQVEADDQQINLSRSSLFFPEKRLFFLERSSIFDFRMGGIDRLFYSRRIGLDDGKPVPIIGGLRLSGRLGHWDVGLMDMQTTDSEELPSENFGLIRLRRQIGDGNSYLGGMVTNRMSAGGSFNTAVGADAILNMWGDEYLFLATAQTYDDEIDNDPLLVDKSRIHASWERRRYQNLSYEFAYSYSGRNYTPEMGFAARDNYKRFGEEMAYGWLPEKHAWIQRHRVFINNAFYWRNSNEQLESMSNSAGWEVNTRNGMFLHASIENQHEQLSDSLEFSDNSAIPPGSYDFIGVNLYGESPGGNLFYVSATFAAGSFYDGNRLSFSLSPQWSVSSNLELSGSWSYNRLRFDDRNQKLDSHILRLRGRFFFSPELSVAAFVQYNTIRDIVISNARLRLNPSEGHDLYLVYNEDYNTDRRRELPFLPHSNNRTILLKYTYTFLF